MPGGNWGIVTEPVNKAFAVQNDKLADEQLVQGFECRFEAVTRVAGDSSLESVTVIIIGQ
jgi:hypothetical protein